MRPDLFTFRLARMARRQRGVAAVELAMILLLSVAMVPLLLTLGSVFWYYNALQKGIHDANRYLASTPAAEASTPASQVGAVGVAQRMVIDAGLGAGLDGLPLASTVTFLCDGPSACGSFTNIPAVLHADAEIHVTSSGNYDPLVGAILGHSVDVKLLPDNVQRYGD
jgi:hypothetical protein